MNTNEKTQQTLKSLDGLERAKAKEGLYNKVLQGAGTAVVKQLTVNKLVFLRAVACIILLAGINVFMLVQHSKKSRLINTGNAFAKEYFSF